MTINLKNVEVTKAGVELRHTFTPKRINEGMQDCDKVRVVCDYFRTNEKMDYASYDKDGNIKFAFSEIFRNKVVEIKNLSVRDELDNLFNLKTAEDILNFISVPALESFVNETVLHLLNSDGLTEDEAKNLE